MTVMTMIMTGEVCTSLVPAGGTSRSWTETLFRFGRSADEMHATSRYDEMRGGLMVSRSVEI